jgi:dipeptidyl aminopeptidase/acylaminoacyl peptidase
VIRRLATVVLLLGCLAAPAAQAAPARIVLVDLSDVTWAPGPDILVSAKPRHGPIGLFRIDAGGTVHRITSDGICGRWSPDGTRIAVVDQGALVTLRPDGSDRRVLLRFGPPPKPQRLLYPYCDVVLAWSPDGTRIAYATAHRGDFFSERIWVIDVATHVARRVWETYGDAEYAWAPDSKRLAVAYCKKGYADVNGGCATAVDILTVASGRAWRISGSFQPHVCLDWAPSQLLAVSGSGEIFVTNPGPRERYSSEAAPGCAAWSPSGTRLAATTLYGGPDGVVVASTATHRFRPLVELPPPPWDEGASDPAWSPNGRSLAFWWLYGRGYHTLKRLYVMDSTTGKRTALLGTPWRN